MHYSKKHIVAFIFILLFIIGADSYSQDTNTQVISASANSWVIDDVFKSSKVISSQAIDNWSNPGHVIRTFFYLEQPGEISIAINAKVKSGTSKIAVSFDGYEQNLMLSNSSFSHIQLGKYIIENSGYHYIELKGLFKESDSYAEIKEVLVLQEENSIPAKFIKDDVYFGRRGPSTHLVYQVPEDGDVAWFYNEIEIDEGQDVIGSYFMANGFAEGYFGIQVNSETERRILFSVWSPYKTDDPKSIPEEYRITLLKKGDNVTAGKFGNEGSGGQSYKKFNWKVNTRYGFLLGAKPTGGNSTDFTAYFFDPEIGEWQLIASFRRPKTDTYLTKMYSFLENFIPSTGVLSRKGGFYNQWTFNTEGNWDEINEARFSADNTARKEARLDYSGGVENNGFFLKNCGFTNDHTPIGEMFNRPKGNTPPKVNFKALD